MSSARHSTVSHMNRLIAAATVAGTVACNKCNSLPGGGYAVVDPMPSPARCPGVVYTLTSKVTLMASDGGMLVAIDVDGLTGSAEFDLDDAGAIRTSVSNATLVSQSKTSTGVRFVVAPAATVGGLTLTLSKLCDAGPASVVANVSWGTSADGSKEARVTLSEY